MPIYHLHICNGEETTDAEGAEFADREAVYEEAIRSARDMLSDEIKNGKFNVHYRFEITDAGGNHVMTVPFSEAVDLSCVPASRSDQR